MESKYSVVSAMCGGLEDLEALRDRVDFGGGESVEVLVLVVLVVVVLVVDEEGDGGVFAMVW